jgi:hypothetical protein
MMGYADLQQEKLFCVNVSLDSWSGLDAID